MNPIEAQIEELKNKDQKTDDNQHQTARTTHDVVFNQLHLTNALNPLSFLFIDQFLRQRNDMIYLFRRQAAVLCPLNLPGFIQHQNG